MPRHPRKIIPLAEIDMVVIMVPPSLVVVSEMKEYTLMNTRR